ncbi:MAG: hypothetical protein U1C72_00730 [Candidatus Pacearchaeota archaeon]|nr:hypothetical protein [Candidatus Pacearchaeota archaeon]
MREKLFQRDAVKAVLLSIALLLVGEAILGWQYNRLEQKRIPQLEAQVAAQQQELARQSAAETLRMFLDARVAGDGGKARSFFTEQAAEDEKNGTFSLVGSFVSYRIEKTDAVSGEEFRFQILLLGPNGSFPTPEIILVKRILDSYYIDSVRVGG